LRYCGQPKTQTKIPISRHRLIIGERIRSHRKEAGFTQEKLAKKVSLNPKYLDEIERGEKIISIEELLRIAKAVKPPMPIFSVAFDRPLRPASSWLRFQSVQPSHVE